MKKNCKGLGLILFTALLAVFLSACADGNKPGFSHGEKWIEDHFNSEYYRGLIDVVEIKPVDITEDTYLGGEYRNVKLDAVIRVNEDYLFSRLYMFRGFEIREEWPESYRRQMKDAKSPREKKQVKEIFDTYTFARGEHPISINVEYALIEGRWMVSNSNIYAFGLPDKPDPVFPDNLK